MSRRVGAARVRRAGHGATLLALALIAACGTDDASFPFQNFDPLPDAGGADGGNDDIGGIDDVADDDVADGATADAAEDAAPDGVEDTTPDAAEDAAPDAVEDAAPDVVEDAAPDVAPDAVEDAAPDAVEDTTPDGVEDTTPDVVEDTTPDVVEDAAPDGVEDTTPDGVEDTTPDGVEDTTPDVVEDTTPDAGPRCGDGVREGAEACDGFDLNGLTCRDFDFDRGVLACRVDCDGFDTAACRDDVCEPVCGARVCGPDPVCGTSCGTCGDGFNCNGFGECVRDDGGGPRFITFNTNVRRFTEGEAIRFTAVVTDPDGIDDVIGGTLRDPVSGATYGSFTTAASEGSYQLELTWAEVDFVRAISFEGDALRTFEAEFFDVAGNRAADSIDVTLYCEDGAAPAACDGVCVSLDATDSCGACDVACPDFGACRSGGASYACACPDGWAECDGACVPLDTATNCGACGAACASDDGLASCETGRCACPEGRRLCGERCAADYDAGACGDGCEVCSDAEACDGYSCRDVRGSDLRIEAASGVLEIYYDGEWRGICDDGFGEEEARVACRHLGGEYVSFATRQTHTSGFWLDDLDCFGTEARLTQCDAPFWGTNNCSSTEHVSVTCARLPVPVCEPFAPGTLVINEVLFDVVGTDGAGDGEFLELAGPPGLDISGVQIAFTTGSDGGEYRRVVLPAGTRVPADGYWVLGGSLIPTADLRNTAAIQNAPDSIILENCDGTVLDRLAYGTFDLDTASGEGDPAPDVSAGSSLGRDGASTDTDDNATDFRGYDVPTPGAANE